MADGQLLNTGTIRLTSAKVGANVPLSIFLGLPASGGGILSPGQSVLLAVYDLKQYVEHQTSLPGGFRETNRDFFVGRDPQKNDRSIFGRPLQDHTVKAGTGVLFLAELEFDKKVVGKQTIWFVKKVVKKESVPDPAYNLQIRMQAAIDASGAPLSPPVVDLREIALGGATRADFSKLTNHGSVERELSLRVLDASASRVLLSQLNPRHCPAQKPIVCSYSPVGSLLVLGENAQAPSSVSLNSTQSKIDLNGLYVQTIDQADTQKESSEIVAPSSLWLHHAGRAICGWYFPVPFAIRIASIAALDGKTRRLFPADVENQIPNQERLQFIVDRRVDLPEVSRATNDVRFGAEFFSSPRIGDDPDLLRAIDDTGGGGTLPSNRVTPTQRRVITTARRRRGALRFVVDTLSLNGVPIMQALVRIELTFDGNPRVFVFRPVSSESRLAWSTVQQIGQDNVIPAAKRAEVFKSLVDTMVEPLPPGTLSAITSVVTTDALEARLKAFLNVATDVNVRRLHEDEINNQLRNLAGLLKQGASKVPDELVAHVRSLASHTFLEQDGKRRSYLEVLDEMAGGMLEREVLRKTGQSMLSPSQPREEDYFEFAKTSAFDGFAAFNFRRRGKFRYHFEFKSKGTTAGFKVILRGSIGGFAVTITKFSLLDPATGPVKKQFLGFYLGGSIGLTFGLDIGGFKVDGSDATSPISCDLFSDVDILLDEFSMSRFVFFAQQKPGIKVSAAGLGIGSFPHDTIFSITLPNRIPPVVLETEINQPFKLKVTTPSAMEVKRILRDVGEATATGDPLKMKKVAASANASLYALTLCNGMLVLEGSDTPGVPRSTSTTLAESLIDVPLETNARVLGAQFARGSAAISDDAREMLELRLAVLRKMVEYPGWLDIEGASSPEWSHESSRTKAEANNLDLSQKRADAVEQAMFAALSPPGKGPLPAEKDIRSVGKGAKPFKPLFSEAVDPTGQMHLDPFSPLVNSPDKSVRDAAQAKINKDALSFYPTLRRVDIVMNGVFALRIFGD